VQDVSIYLPMPRALHVVYVYYLALLTRGAVVCRAILKKKQMLANKLIVRNDEIITCGTTTTTRKKNTSLNTV
jgi:hypothetical protein